VQDIPKSLKTPNKREGKSRLHVIFMTDGGKTGRYTFSVTFFWVMGILLLGLLCSLLILSWRLSSLMVGYESATLRLKAMESFYEARDFSQSVQDAPLEAWLILQRLDQAAALAETIDDEPVLPWGLEPGDGGQAPPSGEGDEALGPEGADPAPDQPAQGEGPGAGEPNAPGDPGEAAPDAQQPDNPGPPNPEAEAWAAFQGRLPAIPGGAPLDVEEFRVTPGGNYSYYLKSTASDPGARLRGRAITIFAVADKAGAVTLAADPKIDLREPSQGYDNGGKYNILSSKVYRGNISVPPGGKILSAQVLAWDEGSKELIFRKKIVIGVPRGD
jgi:hypothetical protein